jgi:hypothetical protein
MAAALAAMGTAVAGCGGEETGDAASPDAKLAKAPGTPPAENCATGPLKTDVPPDDLVPVAGTYTYRNTGTQKTEGLGGGATPLPARMRTKISKARKIGSLRCFTVHRPYSPQLIDNATFVVRGSDVYITRFEVVGAGGAGVGVVKPSPPIKSLDGDELEWSGSFSGDTNGKYTGSVLGRRTVKVGDRSERAVGVELRMAMNGDIKANFVTTSWIGLETNTVLTEKTKTDRSAEGPPIVLDLKMKLRKGPKA